MTRIGLFVTLIYVGGICLLRWDDLPELQTMPLNEFADFLSGIFGPLTFFWLILGYMQQQKELQQNTKALEMQAEELKHSVEQHKELVKTTQLQVETDRQSLEFEKVKHFQESLPVMTLSKTRWNSKQMNNKIKYSFEIKNSGAAATGISFKTEPYIERIEEFPKTQLLENGEQIKISWETNEQFPPPETISLTVLFSDLNANSHQKTFLLHKDSEAHYNISNI